METFITMMHSALLLTRRELWTPDQPEEPKTRREFSKYPRLGFVGKHYKKGGIVLLGANPGSGEGRDEAVFEDRDKKLLTALSNFKDNYSHVSWQDLMEAEKNDMAQWKLDWAISGSLERLNITLDEVAVSNVCPFSTATAPKSNSPVWGNSIKLYLFPFVKALDPKVIIWLGKTGYRQVKKHAKDELPKSKHIVVSRQRHLTLEERFSELQEFMDHQ